MPTLGEFIERAKRFGVKRKHTPKIVDGPRGPVRFYYLQRRAREKDNTIYPIALANLVLHDIKVGKKSPLTIAHFEEFFRLLPARADGEHSWTVEREEIEARGYDLKAVNPHAKKDKDTRTPEELLDLIDTKGREVADAIAALRKMP